MTEIERVKRMTDDQLYRELVHCTDALDVDDRTLAAIEEAAQRLLNGASNDSFTESDTPRPSRLRG